MSRDVPILMYHHVCPEPSASRHFPFAVTPELFRNQMDWLVQNDYETMHLSALLPKPATTHKKIVVITFDDGACKLLDHAVPILQERCMTATFFLPSKLLDNGIPGMKNSIFHGKN